MDQEPRFSSDVIPEMFRSFETGTFFQKCIECECDLLNEEITYFIEKAVKTYPGFRGFDIIFEYAICENCAEEMRKRMSVESMQNIASYLAENMDQRRRAALIERYPDEPMQWIEECLVSGQKRSEAVEYQIFAKCMYDRLLLPEMPYMISHIAADEMANLLSDKTLGEMDDFIGRHFGPPEFERPKKKLIRI